MSDEHIKLRRVEGDLELLVARVDGLRDNLLAMSESLLDVIGHVSTVGEVVNEMRTRAMEPRVETPEAVSSLDERKVWVVAIEQGDEYEVGPIEVLIEQFGAKPPTIAFRRGGNPRPWGRPYTGEAR